MQRAGGNGQVARGVVSAVVTGSTIGIIANPMSGRDIRRVVARASVFPNAEKASMVLRLVAAAGALGVERVLVSTDNVGVAAGVLRAYRRESTGTRWPVLEFVELGRLTGTAADTAAHVRRMRAAAAGVIVVLGGDGTARAAAPDVGDTPLLALSTGTNNAFPHLWEATVAGSAAALVATGRVAPAAATDRAKVLRVRCGQATEIALVDVCISTHRHVGARALWRVDALRELYCAFAEPHAIGLSSLAGQLMPVPRTSGGGVAVRVAAPDQTPGRTVLAPIAPGVLREVGVLDVRALAVGEPVLSAVAAGTVAVDGEREIEFGPAATVTIELGADGPRVLDVRRALRIAADENLLSTPPTALEEEHR